MIRSKGFSIYELTPLFRRPESWQLEIIDILNDFLIYTAQYCTIGTIIRQDRLQLRMSNMTQREDGDVTTVHFI